MFNGHMDTSNTGQEEFLTGIGYKPNAVIKDGMIYGLGIYNMKGALVCYTHAVKALQRAGVKLQGDVILAAVAGEIEKTQWKEFRGREYRGYGVGTHYLVNHGVLPDVCILGEPTDMQIILEHYGSLWVRISVSGMYVHTAFAVGRAERNSIRRLYDVLGVVLKWIKGWDRKPLTEGTKGSPISVVSVEDNPGALAELPSAPNCSSICACRRTCPCRERAVPPSRSSST